MGNGVAGSAVMGDAAGRGRSMKSRETAVMQERKGC